MTKVVIPRETWPERARTCDVCGTPHAFPSDTRWGERHDCQNEKCKAVAWGSGAFKIRTGGKGSGR